MIEVKKLAEDAIVPVRGSIQAAGLDLHSYGDVVIFPGEQDMVSTKIAINVGIGRVGLIWPRSKLANKHGIHVMAGVIDADYRGEVKVILRNFGDEPLYINKGDRIAQLVVQECNMFTPVEVLELSDTSRGNKGVDCTDIRL